MHGDHEHDHDGPSAAESLTGWIAELAGDGQDAVVLADGSHIVVPAGNVTVEPGWVRITPSAPGRATLVLPATDILAAVQAERF